MSRQFTAHRDLLAKVITFGAEHGPLTHDRLAAPEVVATFTDRELTALREVSPALRDPEARSRVHSRFAYPVMAIRDLLIAIDGIGYSAGEQELTTVRSGFRHAATALLDELTLAGAQSGNGVRVREDAPTAPTGS